MGKAIEELRKAIDQSRVGQSRWRCPKPLRQEIIEYSKARRAAGATRVQIARELGVSGSGLARWLEVDSGALRRVRVQPSPPKPAESLVLITPGGYRLEGLSPSTAADLLRRLGC